MSEAFSAADSYQPRDWVRLLATVFLVAGLLALALGIAECVYNLRLFLFPQVPRGIAAVPSAFPALAFNSLLLPVGPLAAWGVLTVLCDIRDGLAVLPEADTPDD